MTQGDARADARLDHRPDIRADSKPFVGMLDARYGDGIDGHEGDNPAADIAERPERLQMRHLCRDDISCPQGCDIRGNTPPLRPRTG